LRLYSSSLESLALKSITSGDDRVAGWLMPRLSPDHFSMDATNEAFRRMQTRLRKSGSIPEWSDLLEDIAISQDSRDELQEFDVEPVANRKIARKLVDKLDGYRRARVLFNMSTHTAKVLKGDKVDLDELTERVADFLTKSRASADMTEQMLHIGDPKFDKAFLKSLLVGKDLEFIPTGIKTFDSRSQGIPRGSAFIVAANTGGGKSLLANSIVLHQASIGARCGLVSLEMSREHVARRMLSSLTKVPLSRINHPNQFSSSEKRRLMQTWLDYHKRVRRNGGRLTILSPDEDVSMEDVLTLLKPYGYDNTVIDYVGLLRGMDGEDQWRKLGGSVRYAARYANATDSVVTVLAQLSGDGIIRYSRAMQEHAALMWQWITTAESRESGIATISQPKARQLEPFDFSVQVDFAHMTVSDLSPELAAAMKKQGDKAGKKENATGNKKSRKSRKKDEDESTFEM